MKSLLIVPLVVLSALSPVDAVPSSKSFPTPDCTGEPSATVPRPTAGECLATTAGTNSEKTLAIEGGATLLQFGQYYNTLGGARGNCDGAANLTFYGVCGKCNPSGDSYGTLSCNVGAGTITDKAVCNADCSVCANQTTHSLGECVDGAGKGISFATGSVWSKAKYSASGCADADLTRTDNLVCNYCYGQSGRSSLYDCEVASPIAAGASTQFAAGLLFAFLMLLLTAF